MPANLTPQYHKAEAAYRAAESPQEELDCLQVMLREIPKHKGTDKLQADLKAKIAKVKAETQKAGSAPRPLSNKIPKQGAGRVLLLGAPNTGKSRLLSELTRAQPEVADYPFTTQTPTPGMMLFENCPFQLIDMPPVTNDFLEGSVVGLVRGADLILLTIDLGSDNLIEDTQAVLERFSDGKTRLGRETALDEVDVGVSYTQTLIVYNKSDAAGAKERLDLLSEFIELPFDSLMCSCETGEGLDEIRKETFRRLGVVRVYLKHPKSKEADREKPYIVRQGDTLVEVAEQVHKDWAESIKGARVWGAKVHPGTNVKPDYEPVDEDAVEMNI